MEKIQGTGTYFNIANNEDVLNKVKWNMTESNELAKRGINKLLHWVAEVCFKDTNLEIEDLTLSPGFLATEKECFQPVHLDFVKIPKDEKRDPIFYIYHCALRE